MTTCYTFGYAGRDPNELAAAAARFKAIVVDVRLKPVSRQPGWSRSALARLLHDRYVHVPALGNLNYKGGPIRLQNVAVGLRQVVDMIEAGTPPILLCAERDPTKCHRTHIATLVAKRTGCEVVHLPLSSWNRLGDEQLGLALDPPKRRGGNIDGNTGGQRHAKGSKRSQRRRPK